MKSRGFDVLHVSEDLPSNVSFDYIIMSHIIEHIQPLDLIDFLNRYLSKLAPTGSLLIATPLLHRGFYDDYDHVKPYTPKALEVLFSDYIQQQAKTMFSMKLTNLWMRKWPLQIELNSSNNKLERRIASYVNRVGELSYWLSHGIISETTGWVGEFRLVTHKM
jgi:predicted SAM-dependent methyltransferase